MVIARRDHPGPPRPALVMHSTAGPWTCWSGAGAVNRLELAYGGTGRFAPPGSLPAGGYGQPSAGGGLLQLPHEPTVSGRRPEPALHPSRSGFKNRRARPEGFGPELRGRGKIPPTRAVVSSNPFTFSGPGAGRAAGSQAAGDGIQYAAFDGARPCQYVGGDGTIVRIKGSPSSTSSRPRPPTASSSPASEVASRIPCAGTRTRTRCRPSRWTRWCQRPSGPHRRPATITDYDPRRTGMYRQIRRRRHDPPPAI